MTECQLLTRFPLLETLPEDKKEQIFAHFRTAPLWLLDHICIMELPANTVFIHEGRPATHIYVVASGTIKAIEYRVLGVQYDFIQFTKVYSMGGMEAIMDLDNYRTTLKTVEDCVAIRIPRVQYEKWINSDVAAMKYEAKLMGEYLLEQGRLAREYMFLPGPERLARLFVRKFDEHSVDGILIIKENRQSLANETGFGTKTINRAVKSLADGGYITKTDRSIIINREQYESLKRLISMIIAPESDI